MPRKTTTKSCMECGILFDGYSSVHKFCSTTCQNKNLNRQAHRLSMKLKPEQLEIMLALENYFIRNWKFDYRD